MSNILLSSRAREGRAGGTKTRTKSKAGLPLSLQCRAKAGGDLIPLLTLSWKDLESSWTLEQMP